MEFKEMYKGMKDPIRLETIDTIIDAYVDSYNFYNSLVKVNTDAKEKGYYNQRTRDTLYVYLFNEWKRSIRRIVERNLANNEYKSIFASLDNYLSTKNPTTTQEVKKIIDPENVSNPNVKKGLEKLSWESVGAYSGWNHIDSSYVYYAQHRRQDIEHRLYINCDSTITEKIAYEFCIRCKKERLRYYFKYDDFGNRSDTFVVYSNTQNLPRYRKILNDIVRECSLQKAIHKPPVLTGVVDGFIGYGTEPEDIDGKRQSFNSKREKHLERCILKTTGLWLKNNLDFEVSVNKKKVPYKEYFIAHIVATIKNKMIRYLPKNGKAKEIYGYDERDIKSQQFDQVLRTTVRRNLNDIIAYLIGEKSTIKFEVPICNKKYTINYYTIMESIKPQIKTISRISTTFKPNLIKIIKKTSPEWGISKENYAFDIKGLEEFAIEDYVEKLSKARSEYQATQK